ncbi:OprO/OprP family phosphate-selective porin [Acinetobacter schindleri]|uniref:OprO/OprP family phosphate-selective porin n=1 Tax=Acinetobacter schindleri TaxID=108981 RepID=UPI00209A78EB|nr:OprO/OprP family phosphate-selective porin [Acinetobacter schindleri]MCO8068260.1 OprO/OprP family phosphate-selective porin [Acinetobacter schindleri]
MEKQHLLAVSVALVLQGFSLNAQANDDTQAELQQLKTQIEQLQKRFVQLEQKHGAQVASNDGEGSGLEEGDLQIASEVTTDDVDGLKADIENFKYDESRRYERQTVKSARDTTLYGTVQVRTSYQDESTRAGNPAPSGDRYSTFDIPTALLGVRGNLFRDYNKGKNLDYQLSFSYSKQPSTAGNNSNFNLQDAFLRYHVFSTNSGLEEPRLNVTLGQQLIPFGLEAQSPEDLRPTITQAIVPVQLGLTGRQNGLIVRGDVKPYVDYGANYRAPLFEYALGVTNGNGINKTDDNDGKDLLARVAYTLPVDYASIFRELKFGASYLKGKANVKNAGVLLSDNGKRDILGFDIYYNHAPFGVTYEYIQAKTEQATVTNEVVDTTAEGHTFTAFYTVGDQFYNSIKSNAKFDDFWPKSIQGYYRYDNYNPNKDQDVVNVVGNGFGEYTKHSLGLNFFFAQTTKFQLALNNTQYKHESATQKDFNEVVGQFQYTF